MKGAIGLILASGLSLGTAVEAAPAWMIITANEAFKSPNARGIVIRDYESMESCEAVSKYIHSLRGIEYDEANWGVQGIWRSNRGSEIKQEPFIVTLCVPDASEIDKYREHIEKLDRYRLLD